MTPRLYHVSEEPGIEGFEPRVPPSPGTVRVPSVWAVDEEHLDNYLLPRDCPRVCFRVVEATKPSDMGFLAGSRRVVAIEQGWLERATATTLHLYRLPPDTFRCADVSAGYYVSERTVVPLEVETVARPMDLLRSRGTEVRVLPGLWALHDAIAASTLPFSMIRMRNAAPRG